MGVDSPNKPGLLRWYEINSGGDCDLIEKRPFGRTGHMSTVAIFGAAALIGAGVLLALKGEWLIGAILSAIGVVGIDVNIGHSLTQAQKLQDSNHRIIDVTESRGP